MWASCLPHMCLLSAICGPLVGQTTVTCGPHVGHRCKKRVAHMCAIRREPFQLPHMGLVWPTCEMFAGLCLSSSSSLGSRCVPWLGEGLSMLSPNYPILCFPLPYRVAPVFVQVVSPSLGWSPLSSFLVIWSPTGDTRGPTVVFEAVDMPCPGPFHFS